MAYDKKKSSIELELLKNRKEELIAELGFEPMIPYIELSLNDAIKKLVVEKCNKVNGYQNKVRGVFVDIDKIDNYAIEYGVFYEIRTSDIKDQIKVDYLKPDVDTFIPLEILKEWEMKQ